MIPAAAIAPVVAAGAGAVSKLIDNLKAGEKPAPVKQQGRLDQADFMTLLVEQLKNQDPLNPLESADFSAQLAQFSSLQELVEIKQKIQDFSKPSTNTSSLDAVSFLGREVFGSSDALGITDGKATKLEYNLAKGGIVTAEITDSKGARVTAFRVGEQAAGTQELDLEKITGAPKLADGEYHVKLRVQDADGVITQIATQRRGVVSGIDLAANPPVLLVDDWRIKVADVLSVKLPAAGAAGGSS